MENIFKEYLKSVPERINHLFKSRNKEHIPQSDLLESEIAFWEKWFRTKGDKWPEEYQRRLNTETMFKIPEALKYARNKELKILDVGSGPITDLGYIYPGYKIKITATDPLAGVYNRLIKKYNLNPLVRPIQVYGERLANFFHPNYFDYVHANNSLDHSNNPLGIIKNMIRVLRQGGAIYLFHAYKEGLNENYSGMHRWDFFVIDNSPFIANQDKSKIYNLNKIFNNKLILKELDFKENESREKKGYVKIIYEKATSS